MGVGQKNLSLVSWFERGPRGPGSFGSLGGFRCVIRHLGPTRPDRRTWGECGTPGGSRPDPRELGLESPPRGSDCKTLDVSIVKEPWLSSNVHPSRVRTTGPVPVRVSVDPRPFPRFEPSSGREGRTRHRPEPPPRERETGQATRK